MVTPKGVVDEALVGVQDNSTKQQSRFLTFFNNAIVELAAERDWECLKKVTSPLLTPVANAIDLPSDYHALVHVTNNTDFFFTKKNKLSDEEAFDLTDDNSSGGTPAGYQETGGQLVFKPSLSSNDVELKYLVEETGGYVYDTTDTLFPDRFKPLFVRMVLTRYYEWDKDEMVQVSYAAQERLLSRMKAWDNEQKPKKQVSKYMRDRR